MSGQGRSLACVMAEAVRTSIAFKLNLIILVVVLSLGAGIGAFSIVQQRTTLREALDRRVQFMGEYLARAVSDAASRQDTEALNAILQTAVLDRELSYVMVKSHDGEILAARWQSGTQGGVTEYDFPFAAPVATDRRPSAGFGPVVSPAAGPEVGRLVLGVDLAPIRFALARHATRMVASLVAAIALALIVGNGFIRFLLRRSIAPLLGGIKAIGEGDLTRTIQPDRHVEIGEIGRAFNEMAARLSSTLVSKAELEGAVAQRTAELQTALQERIRIQQDLAEREERIRLLLDSTAEAIYGLDLEGRCTFCNPACLRILGFEHPQDLIGKQMHPLVHRSRADGSPYPADECPIYAVFRSGVGCHQADDIFWRADGSCLHVEFWSHPIFHGRELRGAVVTFVDITERLKLEDQLVQAQKLEGIGILAGGIAHDFNNLLSPILGYSELTLQGLDAGHPARKNLEAVADAAKRAAELTRQILAFSRRQVLQKKLLNLNDEILAIGKMIKRLIGEDIDVRLNLAGDLPAVEADPTQMQQVLFNLAVNARDAMPGGGSLAVETSLASIDERSPWLARGLGPGRYLLLTVSDTGSGMPAETLQHVFEPFFTTKEAGRGTGLGLSTVHGIVKQHGGDISVYSEPGRGTTFRIYLPAAAAAPSPEAEPLAPSLARGSGTVLLVEDDHGVRDFVVAVLTEYGYDVTSVDSPAAALAAAEQTAYDLVISDVVMPGMSGPELCRKLAGLRAETRVLYISGYPAGAGALKNLLPDGAPLLQKPFSIEALLERVRSEIGRNPAGGSDKT